ncbi:molybdopterin-dependent oxidoreductase [Myxococcota bacterium]|nr:molybdopterin-dependent oxidoreductase [Myxococcota bacterium]
MADSNPSINDEIDVVHRSCTLCEAHCGVSVAVDRVQGRVVDVRGDERDVMSRGYVCPKVVGMSALSEDPDRLRTPVKRVNGEFIEIDWDEALDLVVSRLTQLRDTHGPNSLAIYLGNPNAHDFASNLSMPVLIRALETRWRFSATSVDQLPKMLSSCLLFGSPSAFAVPDIDRTDFLLVLGANPMASNGSIMTAPDMPGRLRRLRERGGRLVVVDPRRSETARLADEHLSIRPGTDALFLFALVHVLFEEGHVDLKRVSEQATGLEELRALALEFSPEAVAAATGIAASETRELAREFAAAPSAACYGRIGTCTQEFGTLASWLVDVLNTITGNLDRPGGVMFPRPAHAPPEFSTRRKGRVPYGRWHTRVRSLPEFGGELPVAALAEEIDTPGDDRVRALLTIAGNPVCSTPNSDRLDRALEGLEFMVSVDLYINETTRHADVILPTSAPLERPNYPMLFHGLSVRNHARWSPAVLEPPAGVRHLWEIAMELAGRMQGADAAAAEDLLLSNRLGVALGKGSPHSGVNEPQARRALDAWQGPSRILDLMLRTGPYGDGFQDGGEGLSLQALIDSKHGVDLGPLEPVLPEMLTTSSGRVELAPDLIVEDVERLRARLDRPTKGLVLVGRRHLRSNNSWMHNLRALSKGRERCILLVHPEDADRLGVTDGSRVSVSSRVGKVVAPVEITSDVMPGVVSLPHGFGHDRSGARLSVASEFQPGVNSNRLTDELRLDELSGNAVLNGIPVDVEVLRESP